MIGGKYNKWIVILQEFDLEFVSAKSKKVEAILQLSPPKNIHHLQCLQGMANFLQRFVVDFSNLTRGFMRLLKKDTTFCWDERSQESFDALKQSLASAPVISPPDYSRDFILYVATSMETG